MPGYCPGTPRSVRGLHRARVRPQPSLLVQSRELGLEFSPKRVVAFSSLFLSAPRLIQAGRSVLEEHRELGVGLGEAGQCCRATPGAHGGMNSGCKLKGSRNHRMVWIGEHPGSERAEGG